MQADDYDASSPDFEAPDDEPLVGGRTDDATPTEAMAVYSAGGQADDQTGNDGGQEALRATLSEDQDRESDVTMPHGPH